MDKTEYIWRDDAEIAPHTTLHLGGKAAALVDVESPEGLIQAMTHAHDRSLPVMMLGGGSNIVVSDSGVSAAVIRLHGGTIDAEPVGSTQWKVRADAGLPWSNLVDWSVRASLQGLECLAGIPGRVGAAPIQNIGAYGQELADVLQSVDAIELSTGERVQFTAEECRFGYRTSRFKSDWRGRFAITRIELLLEKDGQPCLKYHQLADALDTHQRPSLSVVAETVTAIRRQKSMVYDPTDPNHRSAGSFFTNPIVQNELLADIQRRVRSKVPHWPVESNRVKLSAAWLIDNAGMKRGYGAGPVGLSTNHTLALVNRGHATTTDLITFAAHVRARVFDHWGVTLHPEPMPIGFQADWGTLLDAHAKTNKSTGVSDQASP